MEDDQLLARSLARGLGAEGYAVDLAGDGVEGLYLAQEYDNPWLDFLPVSK